MGNFSLFGSTIRETVDALQLKKKKSNWDMPVGSPPPKSAPAAAGGQSPAPQMPPVVKSAPTAAREPSISNQDVFEIRSKAIMRIVVTLILLGISIFLLIDKSIESKTLPCSIISAVTGYWLK